MWIGHNSFKEEFEMTTARHSTELTYASSPVSLTYQLAKILHLDDTHTFLDLGSGFGHICFDIHLLTGAKTIGIECIKERFLFSCKLSKRLRLSPSCTFLNVNFFNEPLPKASHIYITCTCFSKETLSKLSQKLSVVESGTIIITVTQALLLHNVELFKSFNATFDWGRDMIFIYRKI